MGKAIFGFGFPQERVGEDDPDFGYFIFSEKTGKLLYLRPQKSHIVQSFCQSGFSAYIDAVAFYIHAYKISIFMLATEVYAIFAFATGKLYCNRVVIFKIILPCTLHVFRMLQYIWKGLERFEPY